MSHTHNSFIHSYTALSLPYTIIKLVLLGHDGMTSFRMTYLFPSLHCCSHVAENSIFIPDPYTSSPLLALCTSGNVYKRREGERERERCCIDHCVSVCKSAMLTYVTLDSLTTLNSRSFLCRSLVRDHLHGGALTCVECFILVRLLLIFYSLSLLLLPRKLPRYFRHVRFR